MQWCRRREAPEAPPTNLQLSKDSIQMYTYILHRLEKDDGAGFPLKRQATQPEQTPEAPLHQASHNCLKQDHAVPTSR